MAVGHGGGSVRGGRLFFGGRKGEWMARRYVDCGGNELRHVVVVEIPGGDWSGGGRIGWRVG